jgi:hypothetical protein
MNDQAITVQTAEVFSASNAAVRVVAAAHPFQGAHSDSHFPAGVTLAEIVAEVTPGSRHDAFVLIEDELIPREHWRLVRPKPGTTVLVRAVPRGGGGNKILRMVAMLAIAALSFAFPYIAPIFAAAYPILTAAIQVGITVIGNLLINTLIPPASPRMKSLTSGNESPTLSITGARNQLNMYGPIPRVYGRHRITPPYGARPYTEILGKDQWLRLIFDLGYGPLQLSDLRIGETNVDDYEAVQYEIRQGYPDDLPLTLYTRQVYEDPLSILLTHLAGSPPTEEWSVRRTQLNADEISVDVTFNNGLTQFLSDGSRVKRSVELAVEYSVAGLNDWKPLFGIIPIPARTAGPYAKPATTFVGGVPTFHSRYYEVGLDPLTGALGTKHKNDTIRICGLTIWSNDPTRPPVFTDLRDPDYVAAGYFVPTLVGAAAPYTISITSGQITTSRWIITDNSATAVRSGHQFPVARGQYDVRLHRVTADSTDDKIMDKVMWTALRTIRNLEPITEPGHCVVSMRIRATDQLNGVVDEFNCIAESLLLDYDQPTDTWVERVTSNPAAIDIDILRGNANGYPVTDTDAFAWDDYAAWAVECTAHQREFNAVIDFETTVFDARKMVCSAGRAAPTMRDGRFTIVRDTIQSVPVQHFTPRNSFGFKGTRGFPDAIHALRVPFINRETGWRSDERFVYNDGYDEGNASLFETLDMFGVTHPEQVWRDGRYYLAVAKLRPENFELDCDFEHLVAGQGDLSLLTHDVLAVGIKAGRIKSVTASGSTVVAITTDETMPMEPGKSYGVSIRTPTNGQITGQVVTVPGDQTVLTFTMPIAFTGSPPLSPLAAGDLVGFGELGRETLEVLVKSITPGSELAAHLAFVAYAPGVHDSETGPVPPFDPLVTALPRTPLPPLVLSVDSGDLALFISKDGTLQSRITVGLAPAPGSIPVVRYQGQFRVTGSADRWTDVPDATASSGVVSILPVLDGETYDIRVRALSYDGVPSDWIDILAHTVIGKSNPPPAPDSFTVARMADGTRLFAWDLSIEPADVRAGGGFQIRWKLGPTTDWDTMAILPPAFLIGRSLESNELGAGTYTFAIKTIDSSGNFSTDAAWISGAVLGDPRLRNVLVQSLEADRGWPGTKIDCFVDENNVIRALSNGNWNSLPSTWDALASTWDAILPHRNPIQYTSQVFDLGFDVSFAANVTVTGLGVPTIEMKVGSETDGGVVGSWIPAGSVSSKRYCQIRVTQTHVTPTIQQIAILLDADLIEVDYEDINTASTTTTTRYQRLGTGHFLIAPLSGITQIMRAMVSAFQAAGANWTWELVTKDYGGAMSLAAPAAEFKIYKAGVLTDCLVDINIKGTK